MLALAFYRCGRSDVKAEVADVDGTSPYQVEFYLPELFETGGVMKKDLMDILACPLCKGQLELSIEEEGEGEVIKGSLHCNKCSASYPIEDGIPNLLPPQLHG